MQDIFLLVDPDQTMTYKELLEALRGRSDELSAAWENSESVVAPDKLSDEATNWIKNEIGIMLLEELVAEE